MEETLKLLFSPRTMMHRKKGRVNRPEALRRRVVSRLGSILKSSPLSLKTQKKKKRMGQF